MRSLLSLAPFLLSSLVVSGSPGDGCPFQTNASDAAWMDRFGAAVDVDGDWMAVGAPNRDSPVFDAGAVYLYRRAGGSWVEQQILVPDQTRMRGYFGTDLDLDGNTLVVGAPGHPILQLFRAAYVFELQGDAWVQSERLDPAPSLEPVSYGTAVALDGDTAVVGDFNAGPGANGSVHVYSRSGGVWTPQVVLGSPEPDEEGAFGSALDLDGDRLVVGDPSLPSDQFQGEGAIHVFEGAGSNWVETGRLRGEPNLIPNFGAYREMGTEVSLDGDVIFAGTWLRTFLFDLEEAATVFELEGNSWVHKQVFAGAATRTVAVQGDRAVLGATTNSPVGAIGAIVVKQRGPQGWTNVRVLPNPNPSNQALMGSAVAIDGEDVVAGSPGQQFMSFPRGAAFVFDWDCLADDFAETTCVCSSEAPCDNEDAHAGCVNSTGFGGLLRHDGSAGIAQDDLSFIVSSLPSGQFGLVYTGSLSASSTFGDGQRCVSGQVCRLAVQATGSTGSFTTPPGLFTFLEAQGCQVVPGLALHVQGWFRDPVGTCGAGFNLTNAIVITPAP